jgi:hypothetical protein
MSDCLTVELLTEFRLNLALEAYTIAFKPNEF